MIKKVPIKVRKKLCRGCNEETYLFSKGFCKTCSQKQKNYTLKRVAIKPSASKIKSKHKTKEKDEILMSYFEHHIEALYKFKASEESGKPIPYPTNINICHLMCKRLHKSVRGHLDNCIYLTWEEHAVLDNEILDKNDFKSLEKKFPNSFKLIVERMRIVRASVTEKTKFIEAFDKFNETLTF